MSINNSEEYVKSLWDWRVLDGCFGGKIKPSDIDGMVERNGHFLYLETKKPGVELTMGQEIAAKNRVKDGVSTYVVIWGYPGSPERLKIYYPAQFTRSPEVVDCNLDDLREWCKVWYQRVSTRDAKDYMGWALAVQ